MKTNSSMLKWIFHNKDIDVMIITFLISISVGKLVNSFMTALVEPIFESIFKNNTSQVLKIKSVKIYFKIQLLIMGIFEFFTILLIAFIISNIFLSVEKNLIEK